MLNNLKTIVECVHQFIYKLIDNKIFIYSSIETSGIVLILT